MATSSASMAASKLLNLRTAALQNLVRGQLLRSSAASAHLLQSTARSPSLPDAQLFNLFHPESRSSDSINQSPKPRNLNLRSSNLPLDLQWPFGHSVMPIEAARTYVPSDAKDDNYSGSDYDDDDAGDDGEYDDVDEDTEARPRGRKSKN
ncbi:hypothetical protein Salat_0253700 [Sesamum alatum]|uniref:Uncharacterized protein n=1 Tax=Sesamum alatum TaxID=300844 RepID=A0AAE2CYI5_9LAMI|nr:hypothetical protein Salat_0253700 [Sesamum alatum]